MRFEKSGVICGEETQEEIYGRVKDFCDYIKKNFDEKAKILVVTHGIVVKMMTYCSVHDRWDMELFNKLSEPKNAEVKEIKI